MWEREQLRRVGQSQARALLLKLSTLSPTVPGLVDRFDQPEILDDLHDGWMADLHQGDETGGRRVCLLMIRTV